MPTPKISLLFITARSYLFQIKTAGAPKPYNLLELSDTRRIGEQIYSSQKTKIK